GARRGDLAQGERGDGRAAGDGSSASTLARHRWSRMDSGGHRGAESPVRIGRGPDGRGRSQLVEEGGSRDSRMVAAVRAMLARPAVTRISAGARARLAYVALYAAIGALYPYIPIYYHSLGLGLGSIGLVAAVFSAAGMVGSPLWGAAADRF